MSAMNTGFRDAHCRRCGYSLRGLSSAGACPECGGGFDVAVRKTWTRHPRARRVWRSARWPLALLLVVVMAAGAGVGWLYWGWRQEQPAIEWVRARNYPRGPTTARIGPAWLGRHAGRFGWMLERASGLGVSVDHSPAARELPQRLRWLKVAWIHGDGVTEDWIADLGEGGRLEELCFNGAPANDRMLLRLGRQQRLQTLRLNGHSLPSIEVTDAGLAALWQFPELRMLGIRNSQVTSRGLLNLRHVPRLTMLVLDDTQVDDEGMLAVAQCSELVGISLMGTRVTSEGIGKLAGLKNLESLNLACTDVDDAVVDALILLPKLKSIFLIQTRVSSAAIERLREAMPQVEVMWSSQ